MKELFFLVEEALEGGYNAKAIGESIFTEAENIDELKKNIKEAVECHFETDNKPQIIRLNLGTLSGIVSDIARHLGIPKEDILKK